MIGDEGKRNIRKEVKEEGNEGIERRGNEEQKDVGEEEE